MICADGEATRFEPPTGLEALASLQERFGGQVFETVIRASIAYAESAERARSILDYRPDLGADYISLAGEVLDRLPRFEVARQRLLALDAGVRT